MSMAEATHVPVMLPRLLDALAPRDGAVYVDATFGAGGYAKALLEAADCSVWGIDRDPEAQAIGAALSHRYDGRLKVLGGCYGDMVRLLADAGVDRIDGVALDLGVSSMQIDDPARGFSFRNDGPLDMRMERAGPSAADAVNRLAERTLADIIHRYGEERAARRIARAIVTRRRARPFTRTRQLAELVRRVTVRSRDGLDPATRTFQALRIHVNDELGELDRGLTAAEALLVPGGRMAVVSFHSLEDRMVKRFFRARSGLGARGSRHQPAALPALAPSFRLLARRALRPTAAEVAANSRASAARLRWAERTDAAAWPDGDARPRGGLGEGP